MKKMVCALVIGLIIPAFAGAAIHNLQVSNNTSAAVTISWITDVDDKGEVHYSERSDLSDALTDWSTSKLPKSFSTTNFPDPLNPSRAKSRTSFTGVKVPG